MNVVQQWNSFPQVNQFSTFHHHLHHHHHDDRVCDKTINDSDHNYCHPRCNDHHGYNFSTQLIINNNRDNDDNDDNDVYRAIVCRRDHYLPMIINNAVLYCFAIENLVEKSYKTKTEKNSVLTAFLVFTLLAKIVIIVSVTLFSPLFSPVFAAFSFSLVFDVVYFAFYFALDIYLQFYYSLLFTRP